MLKSNHLFNQTYLRKYKECASVQNSGYKLEGGQLKRRLLLHNQESSLTCFHHEIFHVGDHQKLVVQCVHCTEAVQLAPLYTLYKLNMARMITMLWSCSH